ncbi:hypothetical protein WJX81_007783 [Elliptochloris bilobata]|uniref:Uncharacterized protein n=1 Tax=Elliptochloris bilobata TaxID=381761 RepID=A0AAW1QW37_9CHLO
MVAGLLQQQVMRSTLRGVGCPVCFLPPRLLRLHVGPLPSLRTFTRRPLSTVTVRAQRTGLAEGKRAALAASFAELGLGQDLLTFLAESRLGAPTEIQSAAIPEVLAGGDVLLASHTGSGKTLAYLLPLVKLLKDGEASGAAARPRRPRALVLGPTRELTDQLLRVAKSMSHHARFRSTCVNGGGTFAQQAEALAAPLDILVGTPGKVAQHAAKGNLFYGDVQLVVLDEADTMFDRGFGPEVRAVLAPLKSKASPARVVLVCATLTPAVRKLLAAELPDLRRVETRSLHRGVAGARHGFLEVLAGSNKLDMLRQVVTGEQARGRRVMVFCNTLDSCRAAEHSLRESGAATLCYHGDVPLDGRREAIAAFTANAARKPVLVCTDLAARGLDVPGRVDHVVNFDFPLNPVDYLHRTGRTARAGAGGRITSLIARRDAVLAKRIEAALAADRPLDELSAARAELPPHMRPKPETLQRRLEEARAERHARRGRAAWGEME